MKLFSLFWKLGLIALVLLGGCLKGPETDSSEKKNNSLSGRLVLEDDTPAADVVVWLYAVIDSNSDNLLGLDTSASRLDKTDSQGDFVFESPGKGTYILKASSSHPETGIPLLAYVSPFLVPETENLGDVLLQPAGSLKVKVLFQGSPVNDAQCYIPLTPFHSSTGDSGICSLAALPPGLHDFHIFAEGFTTHADSGVEVKPDKQISLENIELLQGPIDGLNGPSALVSKYDPSEGIVRLKWKMGRRGENYRIYRRFQGETFQDAISLSVKEKANTFEELVFPLLTDSDTLNLIYSLVTDGVQGSGPYQDFPSIIVTPPHFPYRPSPDDEATSLGIAPVLFWAYHPSQNSSAVFDVYLGTSNPPDDLVAEGQSDSRLTLKTLAYGTTYFWMVAVREEDSEKIKSPVWRFTTRSAIKNSLDPLQLLSPADSAVDQELSVLLSWDASEPDGEALTYTVYFDEQDPPKEKVADSLGKPSHTVENLKPGVNYYWNIVAANGKDTLKSVVSMFRTKNAPAINSQPEDQTVKMGQSAVFEVRAEGAAPLSYEWRRNEKPITGADGEKYKLEETSLSDNKAEFDVIVTNSAGKVTSRKATLRVTQELLITKQPGSLTVMEGQDAKFSVTATGKQLSYQWHRDGKELSGENSDTYILKKAGPGDDGSKFTVAVGDLNEEPIQSDAAELTVELLPPKITGQPGDRTIKINGQASFEVIAEGSKLDYQWYRNNKIIEGASSPSYQIPKAAGEDNDAKFRVVVSNKGGSDTSSQATLTVYEFKPPPNFTYCSDEGQTCTYTGTADIAFGNDGSYKYLYKHSSGSIPCNDSIFSDTNSSPYKACYTKPVTLYKLTTATNGEGAVSPGSGTYEKGKSVELTASPSEGWKFNGWSGDASGTANPETITMDGDKTVTATFSQIPTYELSTSVMGEGTVSPGSGTYMEGRSVELTAAPAEGWEFLRWGSDAGGKSNPLSITMDADKSITASFVELPIIKLLFNEKIDSSVSNTGLVTATFTKTTPPNWSTNVPANGGSGSVDFGNISGAYYIESEEIIPELVGLESFTIAGWVNSRSPSITRGGNRIVSWINKGGHGVDIACLSNGALKVGINQWTNRSMAASSPDQIPSDADAPKSNWRFFAITYESSTGSLNFYFGDNTTSASLDKTVAYDRGKLRGNIGKLAIGHLNAESRSVYRTSRMFKGLMDQIEIYDSALSLTKIQTVQNIADP